ncbi:PAS domain-containing protein [Pararoseomonas sp. SCSIO 73927]|uniref:PAS domain-containing protein n=1 Tax=Pararoseomonas sp. SCSIO 73927 TaxID=3114537 RepID=UPI0030D60753
MNYQSLFETSPNPYLVLDRRSHVVGANRAYLASSGRQLSDITGRWVWDAFPASEETRRQVDASLDRVVRTRQPDTMALLRFDVPRPEMEVGGLIERYWSITHAPVLDTAGEVEFILQHPVDVTGFRHLQEAIERSGLSSALGIPPVGSEILGRAQGVYDSNLALRTQRDGLAEMFAQAPSFMALLRGPDHRFELANGSYLKLIGHREVLGRPIAEALPDAAAQGYLELLDHVFETGETYFASGASYAVQAEPGGDADQRYLDFVYQPIRDRQGEVTGIFVEGTDVTDRKAGEVALAASEARYRTLFETVESGFCIIELRFEGEKAVDYRIVEANPAFERLTGQSGVTGRWVSDFAPNLEAHWFEAYGSVALTGEPVRFENAAEPFQRWYDVQALRIGDPAARRVAILFNDITERRKAEDALLDLTASLEAQVEERTRDRDRIWRLSTDIMLVAGFGGTVTATNPAWEAVLGWTEAELLGRDLLELVHPDDLERSIQSIAALESGEAPWRFDNRFRHKDGSHRWIAWAARPEDGRIFAVGRDIQREKEQAEALQKTEDALRQSQKMETVGQLTGGVAHDFNNLLTIIRSSVDFLRRPGLPEERRQRYVEAVSDTVDRAARLTGQLLAFARRQALKPEVFDVGARLRAVGEMLDTVTGSRIHVAIEVPDEPCFARADVSQFETALVNMAVNARDAMEGQGRLTLALAAPGPLPGIRGHAGSQDRFVAVSVTDTGSGIAPGQISRIFEPFYTTKEVGKGTGLGLSQVFGFAKQSGGDVDVRSVVGDGTTFTLYLPEERAEGGAADSDDTGRAPAPAGTGQCVLVVEDNIEVGRFCTQILEDLGYRTAWAANAEEALARLGADGHGFDVVFSDVVMPGMGGIVLAQTLRERLPGLPVVLTSGYSHVLAQEADHGFELLHKPYSADQVGRALQRVISKAAATRGADVPS